MSEELKHWLFQTPLGKSVLTLACVISLWLLIRFIKILITNHVRDNDRRYRSRKLLSFSGYILTALTIIGIFSYKLNNIGVALGIAGAGIAFALQEVIASVAGWLAVMFGGFYSTGDRVQLGGIKGDVIDIGVLRTTLMETGQWVDGDLYNGRIVRVANSFVFKEPVFNYSADFPFLWDEIKIPVQYGSNYQKAREIFLSVANDVCGSFAISAGQIWQSALKKYLIEDASTDPMVTLVANANWVEFTIRYTVDYKKRRITKDMLFGKILNEIARTKGEIKFASSTIQLITGSEMNLGVSEHKT
ncbi:MAG: mechanosensitive ion channel domain-containing protein [Ferruginibacter sp.]